MATKYTDDLVKEIVETGTGGEYTFVRLEETGKKDPITGESKKRELTVKHNKCGKTYSIPVYEFMEGKRRCGKCKGDVLRKHFADTIEDIRKKTTEITHGEYLFVDDHYVNSKTVHTFKHIDCGKEFPKTWDKFKGTPSQPGQRCPNCQRNGMESMASRYVRDILDHFGVEYVREKRFIGCRNPETEIILPFDYYLPKINLIIEVDGEQHERACFTPWDVEGTIKRDRIKNKYAEKNGIALVRIPAKEWPALPKFLFDILSEKLVKNLTLQEVQEVKQSTHPERINADLKKIHNGEYALEDNFYTGTERTHRYRHIKCGCIFPTSLAYLKENKHPCPDCREKSIQKSRHARISKKLFEKTKGKYSLSNKSTSIDEKWNRLIHCHTCGHEWGCTVGNLMKGTAGCPKCFQKRKDEIWRSHYDHVVSTLKKGMKLDKKYKHWVWQNKQRHTQGKLSHGRFLLLQQADLDLI